MAIENGAIVGANTAARFPVDSTCPGCPKFCHSIDGRFEGDHYSYPILFNPGTSEPLSKLLEPYSVALATGATWDPLTIWRGYIPWRHTTDKFAVAVYEHEATLSPNRTCCKGVPDGISISVVAQKLDHTAYCEEGKCDIEKHLKGTATVIKTGITDLEDASWSIHNFSQTVADGEVMLLGFRIDTPPDDITALKCLDVTVAGVASTTAYTFPLQMD